MPAVLHLPYYILVFTSALTLKKKKFQGSHITFANFEREGKPAESKAQIAHLKST